METLCVFVSVVSAFVLPSDEAVPYFTVEVDASSVVHVTVDAVSDGEALTLLITGGAVSATVSGARAYFTPVIAFPFESQTFSENCQAFDPCDILTSSLFQPWARFIVVLSPSRTYARYTSLFKTTLPFNHTFR